MIQALKKNKYHIVFVILLILGTIELFEKSKYGFGDVDEPFYLSVPYRMVNGDALFLHEWNLSQMTGILLYPLMKLYMVFHGTTEGIILNFRHIYILVDVLVCTLFYINIKKYSHVAAIVYSIAFLLYAPLNIMALSYNTIGIMCMTMVSLLVLENGAWYRFYIAGILYACAVLCNPYLAIIYIIFFVSILVIKNKDNRRIHLKQFGFYTLGIFTLLVIWMIAVFSKISVGEFITSLSPILKGDAGHTAELWKKPFTFLIEVFLVYKASLIVYILYVVLMFMAEKATSEKRNRYTIIATLATVVNIFFVSERLNFTVNSFTMPISALCLYLVIVYRKQLNLNVFKKMWLPGLVYAFTLQVASDNGIATITIAGTLMMLAGLIYLSDVYRIIKSESKEQELRIFKVIIAGLFICQIGIMAVFRWIGIYWDDPINYQNTYISEGPEKGIIASKERADEYKVIYDEVQKLDSSKKTLFFTSRTWMYILDDFENVSFSAWIWHISPDTVKRFETYYEINPDKKPEVVYIDYVNAELAKDWEAYGYSVKEQTPSGGYVLEAQN